MSAADKWNVGLCVFFIAAQVALGVRLPHYMRTGRWFR